MRERYTEFLVDPTGKTPKNIHDSIRRVQNASAGFIRSWSAGDSDDAAATSHEAFEHLDYIQNELIRQRDVHKKHGGSWPTSPFKTTLSAIVGQIVAGTSVSAETWFKALVPGSGSLPLGSAPLPLTLETALAKLKHRDTIAVNFSVALPSKHVLYVLTTAGMGQPSTLIELDIHLFCAACKCAAKEV